MIDHLSYGPSADWALHVRDESRVDVLTWFHSDPAVLAADHARGHRRHTRRSARDKENRMTSLAREVLEAVAQVDMVDVHINRSQQEIGLFDLSSSENIIHNSMKAIEESQTERARQRTMVLYRESAEFYGLVRDATWALTECAMAEGVFGPWVE